MSNGDDEETAGDGENVGELKEVAMFVSIRPRSKLFVERPKALL